jgi:hypothetical protein
MEAGRSRKPRGSARMWLGCALLALTAGTAWAAEEAGADSGGAVPMGPSYSVEATASYHSVNHAYFGADWGITSDPGRKSYTWGEGFTRVRWNYGLPRGVWLSAGGVLMATAATDYYGVDGAGDGRLDQLLIGASGIGGSGWSVVAGRQDLQIGDGFLIGDGTRDSKAALWNIPLNFYDAVRADWAQGPWHAVAFGARLSPSFGEEGVDPKGNQYGGELGWSASGERSLALGCFQRVDDGGTELDARAFSLRGALGARGFTLAGELVGESGTAGEVDLKGRGGHLGLTYAFERKGEPYAQLEYFLFSGDDPETPEQEGFYPWEYRWTDWSRYYVADLVASTLVFNNDARIWKLECGVTPLENTSLRLLLHRIDLDTGASYGGIPEGVGRGFADEADLVVDQALGERWSAWVMGGYAVPREAAKALVGEARSGQLFVSLTYKFEGPGGD